MNFDKKKFFLLFLTFILAVGLVSAVFFYKTTNHKDTKLSKIYDSIPSEAGKNLFYKQSAGLTKDVDPELIDLDSQVISCSPDISGLFESNPNIGSSCIGPASVFAVPASQLFLGGQCCGAMLDTHKYHEQLEALKKFSYIKDFPLNPYKTPVELAKKLIYYNNNTVLTADQQKIYDDALTLSDEGPCCCKCWHWYVNEGLAKKLIIEYGFNAHQIAEIWDLSDICGGSGHMHGEGTGHDMA